MILADVAATFARVVEENGIAGVLATLVAIFVRWFIRGDREVWRLVQERQTELERVRAELDDEQVERRRWQARYYELVVETGQQVPMPDASEVDR